MRSTFGHSTLVRRLGAAAAPAVEASGMDFAERLSLWLGAFDAIRLQSAHQAIRALETAEGGKPPPSTRAADLAQDVQRVRAALEHAIAQDPLALARLDPLDDPRLRRRGEPAQAASGGAAGGPGYAPYQQRHLELQRQMEMMITPLRDHVRQAVARAAPKLRALAVLDAAFEQALAAREQALLPRAGALLKRRYEQRRADAAGVDAGGVEDFSGEWRQALLAELDLRLEPVMGLVEALGKESVNR